MRRVMRSRDLVLPLGFFESLFAVPSSTHMSRARTVLLVLLCLLYVGSWPGAVVRPLVVQLTAAPLPEDVGDRDGRRLRGADPSPSSARDF